MSAHDKIESAICRSLPTLPAELRQQLQAMLSPQSLALVVGTVLLWAGDAMIGLSTLDGARELYRFGIFALNAQTSIDLDRAATHFALGLGNSASRLYPLSSFTKREAGHLQ